jgi:hypothetical protein
MAMGGTAYVLDETAGKLSAAGQAQVVADAPAITQPVHGAVLLRNRHRTSHRRMMKLLRSRFALRAPRVRAAGQSGGQAGSQSAP